MKSFTEIDDASERGPRRFTLALQDAETGQGVLVTLTGDLDVQSAPRLLAALSEILTERREVGIDLSRVTFLDVAGARALVRIRDQVTAAGGSVRVVGLDYERLPAARVLDLRRHLEARTPGQSESG